ncbi:TMV resistance protein N-like [Pyrus ussuriensis x Pyrus communis]|uniref:ADP-ribosyl cyclase/cyclic ADP-ribose hydrolase n=1 Tax=Pyrus ussuriensis x Pyrus communis TaxID=2448454 RepID=A0A5N5FLL3_9ROSA|nr:TMV resistance protein N-like [Pyrus ussuriensis x Pyrus communis]
MWFRSLTFSSSSSSAADSAAGDADDVEIPPLREKYDVFLSFRGEDTRRGITSHLHRALEQSKIETYIDDRLQRGEEIGPALVEAIEKSRLSVIIFSKNYPSSTWCLKELVHILKCKERCGQMVIPVFYDISPSDIRNQQGSYAVAFARLEKRFKDSINQVQEWRNALTTAANLSGFDYSNNPWTEAVLVKKVVDDIWNKLIRESSCDLNGLVGIERRIEQIESLLCIHSPDACITVGIWGMGGIGKTTIAETVFHKLSSKFEASFFLRNVRENSEQTDGLDCLEKKLLEEILKKKDLSRGSTFVRESLSRTKVLIVLDDVSDSMQMDHLAGKRLQYGTGSRIIITSRDRRTLRPTVEEDKIYEVEGLKPDDALQLFCSRAFENNSTPITDYKGLAEKAVDYAGGIPLALVLLGSSFLNCKSKEEWEDELNKLKEFPNENIHKVLRLSYDRLGRNEKEIFLDIACFHKGRDVDEVKRMLDVRGFFAVGGIRVLVDMSLISIHSTEETIEMHDLLQEMGSTIVLEQCIEDPSQRSRLFKDEDVSRVLQNNTGTPIVQAILVDWYKIEEQTFADFKVMSNLMMLIVHYTGLFHARTASLDLPNSLRYLYWYKYPLKCLPSNFSPKNLVELHMPSSKVKKLWNEEQRLVNLKVINLQWSRNLTEVPNLSGSREIVHIKLTGCDNLVEIPGYFQRLDKLTYLDLGYCKGLKYLPEMPENIETLKLYVSGIQELPDSVWSHEKISYLDIRECRGLKKLPSNKCKLKISGCFYLWFCTSLGQVSELPRNISELSLVGCKRLVSLPTDICKLKSLKKLKISRCSKLGNFPEILDIPSSIYSLTNLKTLRFRYCRELKELPSGSIRLLSLKVLDLHGTRISEIPDGLVGSTSLQDLDLGRSMIRSIPASIKQASQLHRLSLIGCKRLQSLPELPVPCNLGAEGCTSLKTVPSSRTALTQGWDKYTYFGNRNFLNCRKLDHNARSNIMDEAQLIFMRIATKPRKESWIPTFSYQSEGSSVHIKLPPEFFRTGLLGFVLSIVGSCVSNCNKEFVIKARCNVKSLGESHELFTSSFIVKRKSWILNDCCDDGQDHVYMWYESVISEKEAEMCSPDVYKLANEASVEFRVEDSNRTPISSVKVKKCGIWPLYAEDVEKFKLDRVFISGEPKIQEETREDETWEASGSSYKNKANESDDESEASESSYDSIGSDASEDE